MRPLGLYVHWPYCAKICPYCDFTVAKNRAVDSAAWARVLIEDLRMLARHTEARPLESIYFGGGTPSLMPPAVASAVLEEAEQLFGFRDDIELTLEANPDDRARFRSYSELGLNRISLGVQSFDDQALAFLGRNHNSRDARLAIDEATAAFDRVSLDFIYARPGQTLDDWSRELDLAIQSGVGHFSLYQLTIEAETAFGRARDRGTLVPMIDDEAADLYTETQAVMTDKGLPAYEVSNHARAGDEAIHNSLYWNDADWLAIGPGAHGRLGPASNRLATIGSTAVTDYTERPLAERVSVEHLTVCEARTELLAGGLRQVRGLSLALLGTDREAVLQAAQPLVEGGWLRIADGQLAATPRGRLVLDYLSADLSAALGSDDDV